MTNNTLGWKKSFINFYQSLIRLMIDSEFIHWSKTTQSSPWICPPFRWFIYINLTLQSNHNNLDPATVMASCRDLRGKSSFLHFCQLMKRAGVTAFRFPSCGLSLGRVRSKNGLAQNSKTLDWEAAWKSKITHTHMLIKVELARENPQRVSNRLTERKREGDALLPMKFYIVGLAPSVTALL